MKTLDRFYVAIEGAAKGIESWSERQHFLNTVYERFFQGFSVKQAYPPGIVYTPQEIVDFMCNSVDEILKRDFGTSIAEPGVKILDPATGTGNFIVNLMQHHIPRSKLKHKYMNDLFCNEITLLPYYIASLNIEHEYYERMKEYESFEGICFADTLELAEGKQLPLFVQENTERVQREKDAQIKDTRSGIVSDPNNLDDEEYIVRLVGRVVTVSVESVRLVGELARGVGMGNWMDEGVV